MAGTRAAIAVALALLAGPTLSGCSGDDPVPKVEPSSPAPSSTSSDSSPSPSRAGLTPEETVRAWVKAQNEAMATGDLKAVRALATGDCAACAGLIDPIGHVYERGGHFETSGWSVDKAREVHGNGRRSTVNAAVTMADGITYPSASSKPRRFGRNHSIVVFKLARVDGEWLVSFIGFLS